MGSRSHRTPRCPRCRLHERACVCATIPTLPLRTRIDLVMHEREVTKTTATGPVALLALPNHGLHVHGLPDERVDLSHLDDPTRRPLLLFPRDDAQVLDAAFVAADPRPVTLVVPDGNWKQAKRMARRLPGLDGVPAVVLPPGRPTAWKVRFEPQPGGMATFEAIARAIGILESREAQAELEALFARIVDATMSSRQPPPGTSSP